ncbi:uncharacterized protein LOC120416545 isoform X1 [Culex pipiens pallens]|uniref:uncharacterized protein LOC120416545 isoform X1 n=1 Tax=Culex pipiens pallens TaxID=42434 RepID=UPI0019540006|nr:uncharacterized protein LOC120416545 isoform X1 [Culex pipiens pallens]
MEEFAASLRQLPDDDLELMSSMLYALQKFEQFNVFDDVMENSQGLRQYADYGTDYETTNPLMRSRIVKLRKCHIIINDDTRSVWKAKYDVQPVQQPEAAKTPGRTGPPTVEKGLSAAEKLMKVDLKVDNKLHLCHMLPRTAFTDET